jgi:hypothetical protein
MADHTSVTHHVVADQFPYWNVHKTEPMRGPPSAGIRSAISWDGPVNVKISWGSVFWEGNYKMYEHRQPVRMSDPQVVSYRYRDQDGVTIDLTNYVAVYLLVKYQNAVYETAVGRFEDKVAGKVAFDDYVFQFNGIWVLQFVSVDGLNKTRHGDPAQVKVVKNTEDLVGEELMPY